MCLRIFRRLITGIKDSLRVLRRILKEMMKSPDTLEQGFWAVLALFWGVAYFFVNLNELLIITIMFSLLIVSTVFWSYYQRI